MRIAAFVPAVLALTLFSATQAAPTSDVALLKREDPLVDAVANIVAKAFVDVSVDPDLKAHLYACADVDVELHVEADVGHGLLTADADVEKIQIKTRAELDADAQAHVAADVKAKVIAPVKAIVAAVLVKVCPTLEVACIHAHAVDIFAQINAEVYLKLKDLLVTIKADVEHHAQIRLKALIPNIALHAGVAEAKVSGKVWVASNVDLEVHTIAKIWADLCAKVKADIVAKIAAL
ncbi:hypothetical protein BGX28_004578 [Mortierella sp. GBA30]|nr:hypothetical protein BGX28_004578 [Mortierella sp. GBA30]